MLEAYALDQTISAGGVVPLTSVSLVKGATATLYGSSIQLNRRGIYSVCCIVTGLPGAAGDVTIQMQKDGTSQAQATASVAGAATATGVTLPIFTLVQVDHDNTACCCTSPVIIQFVNTGVELTGADVSIVVTKVC